MEGEDILDDADLRQGGCIVKLQVRCFFDRDMTNFALLKQWIFCVLS